ncbi:hypothetical protein LJR255_004515 [Pararhizobium sp. LjRoot255]|uniref:hypothetical protein n=1 Tax=Pararhizobium sp. LjRoot255 TaxID=3342298 RepID=UPI003ECE94A0
MAEKLTGAARRLRDELIGAAIRGTLRLTYGQFGDLVGLKPAFYVRFLDAIADYERENEKPDVTYILVSKDFPYPSKIGGKMAKPPSSAQKKLAHAEMQKVIDEYCPGKENPYPEIL